MEKKKRGKVPSKLPASPCRVLIEFANESRLPRKHRTLADTVKLIRLFLLKKIEKVVRPADCLWKLPHWIAIRQSDVTMSGGYERIFPFFVWSWTWY